MKKIAIVASAFVMALAVVPPALATNQSPEQNFAGQQKELFTTYGITNGQKPCLKIDSLMSQSAALGDSVVPVEYKELHAKMKPYLRVVPVIYRGFDDSCVHVGQIVVHRDLVRDTVKMFIGMYKLNFPIKSVIPESKFNYVDRDSMLANNTSNYRPERLGSGNLSEHAKGAAFDINPFTNPFMVMGDDGSVFVDPPGATYDPTAKGALYKDSPVRKMWTALDYEWGGNWGDPNADPPTDFYQVGYFDYQHFQLNFRRYDKLPLPSDI